MDVLSHIRVQKQTHMQEDFDKMLGEFCGEEPSFQVLVSGVASTCKPHTTDNLKKKKTAKNPKTKNKNLITSERPKSKT